MHKWFALMILFNIVIGIVFVFSNYFVWNTVNQSSYYSTDWGPINVEIVPKPSINGEPTPQIAFLIFNYPFWLFWVAMIGNLIFMTMYAKGKEKSTKSSS